MRLIAAFLKLIRVPNLIFIALTQFLFYYCILVPLLKPSAAEPSIDQNRFVLLVVASVVIAAAGYIINDYFDVDIDQVNRPKKNVVDMIVSRRWAMLWRWRSPKSAASRKQISPSCIRAESWGRS